MRPEAHLNRVKGGPAGAFIGWAVSVAPVAVVVAAVAVVVYFGFATPASAQLEAEVCDRTQQVRDAIVAATDAEACGNVTALQLRDVVRLDLSDKSITSLKLGDFDGLHGLDVLDLSDNSLVSLPAGIFDNLLLLRTLRLHDNSLTTLPDGIFDQLFLLEEITLNDNQLTSLPEGLVQELSRFDGFAANGDAPDNSGSHPRIQRFIDRHSITTPEEFIAALPDAYKQRFVLVYSSEAAAAAHVSGDYPRAISFGGDGALTFAWNTDPSAPAEFRQSVEFVRQNDTDWTAGVIDFSGESPQIIEPASCQSCHGPLNKPMWGMWGQWAGSETVVPGAFDDAVVQSAAAAMERVLASSDPRIEPLDFSASSFEGGIRFLTPSGRVPSVSAVEEAGAVWAWRHAEVLYRILRGRYTDFRSFSDGVVCNEHDQLAAFALTLNAFSHPEQNLFVSDANEEFPDEPGYKPPVSSDLVGYTYYFHTDGSLADAVLFLLIADVWRDEPIVRRLYRSVSNSDTILPDVTGSSKSAMLHYPAGSATAEDELIQKLRLHFGQGTAASLDTRAEQNGRKYIGGVLSASFRTGHLSAIWPRICNALTGSVPGSLSVALEGGDAVLSWEAPTHDADAVAGYRIWRGSGAADPTVHVADSGSAETTWTDEDPAVGDYVYLVQALYDDYYPGRESAPVEVSVSNAPHTVGSLTAVAGTNRVTLDWDAPSSGLTPTGYRILRGPTSTTLGMLVSDTSSTATTYVDSTASTDVAYSYSVRALNGSTAGPAADPVRIGPEVSGANVFSVIEGSIAVGVLSATDADTEVADLVWSMAGGVDASRFSLSASGVLVFSAAKDFEDPDDADSDGTYELTVRVSDGQRAATGDVEVSLADRNEAPTADAGADQTGVVMGATVTLAGSGTDPDAGDTLAYAWTQPEGISVTLSGAATATATFDAPGGLTEDTTLVFALTVTDAGGLSHQDQVSVTVEGPAPAAPEVSGANVFSVIEGSIAVGVLSATDADTEVADLVWSMAGGVDASRFSLSASGVLVFSAAKDFEDPDDADSDGTYELTVRVSDGQRAATGDVEVSLADRNEAPTADAGADQTGVVMGATVTLAGSGTDPDAGDTLAYAWTQPEGVSVTLSGAATATATFDAPGGLTEDTTLVFALTVTDAGGLSHQDQVSVTVEGPAPAALELMTAEVVSLPQRHDGSTSFTFDLVFSEEVAIGYRTVRDSVFEVTSGEVTYVRRYSPPSNMRWVMTVAPSSDGDVVLVLPSGRSCESNGAVCTSDGRMLSNRLELTVEGPAPAAPEVSGANVFSVIEGSIAVGVLSATDADTEVADLVWSMAGGVDASRFSLSASGVLVFSAAKDFEDPDDADSDGTYELTVRVSDGQRAATGDVEVSLADRNEAPTADAGADQTGVVMGAAVTLAGSGTDPDAGDTLAYAWTQPEGVSVTLSGAATATATFDAPGGLTEDATLVFALTVTDAGGLSHQDQVSVTVEGPAPAAPEVSGANVFSVIEGSIAVGVLSATDADTEVADLVWSLAGGVDASRFSLSASGVLVFSAAKDFEDPDDADSDGTYELTVRVSDGQRAATGDVEVSLADRNEAPTADAGADQTGVVMGATVTLAGSGTDPDAGDTLAYAWTQPEGVSVTLSGAATATATFDAPGGLTEDTTLVFALTVTDAGGLSHQDQVSVTVEGPAPAAPEVSGANVFSVIEGSIAVGVLSATDADTEVADLVWSMAGGVDASRFSLSASGVLVFSAAKDFEDPDDADSDGTYELTVRVSDGQRAATGDVEVSLADRNEAPTADAGADQTGVVMGATVTLAGSGTDPDAGDTLAYAWTQPEGISVTLSGAATATATFDAPGGLTEDTTLVFALTVTDAGGLSHQDQVSVTVEGPAPAVEWGERLMDRDIVLGGSSIPSGLWSNGTDMWIITNWQRAEVSVYSLADGSLQPSDSLVLPGGNGYLSALWSDNTTLWAADFYGGVRAYRLSDGARMSSEDFDSAVMAAAGNLSPTGLWSNGNIMWVADYSAMKAFAYLLSDKTRVPARDIDLVGGGGAPINSFGIWSNGHTLLTASWLRGEIAAQALSDGQRQPDRDLDTSAIQTHNISGIWSNGEILWVVFDHVTRVYAFAIPGLD